MITTTQESEIPIPAYLPFTHNRDDAPAYWSNDILWIMLATAQETAGTFSVMEQLCAHQSGPPLHLHATQDETFYVIDGTIEFYAGGQTMTATPGAFIAIPMGTPHWFKVTSESARVLNAYYPAGFEQVIMGTSHPTTERTLPPANLPPLDWEKGVRLAKEYGMVFLKEEPAPVTDPNAPKPFMIYREQGPAYWSVGILWVLLAEFEETAGRHSMLDEIIPEGRAAPPHRHEAAEEIFYILDGEATFFAGEDMQPLKATPGSLVVIPKQTRHAFQIDSETVHLVNSYTPAGFEHTIAPAAVPATALTLPPADLPPTDMADAIVKIMAVADQYPGSRTTIFSADFLNRTGVAQEFDQ